jgi:hypothetical protein
MINTMTSANEAAKSPVITMWSQNLGTPKRKLNGGIFGLLEILPGGDGNERQQDRVNHSYNSDNKPSYIVVSAPDVRRNKTMETGQSKQANRYRSEYDNSAVEPSRGAIDPITEGMHKEESR